MKEKALNELAPPGVRQGERASVFHGDCERQLRFSVLRVEWLNSQGGSIINTGSIQSFDPSPNAQKEAKFRDAMFPLEMPREWVAGAERAFLAATRTCRRSGELAKLKAVAKWLLCRAQGATGCDPAVALRILAFDHREVRLDLCHVL